MAAYELPPHIAAVLAQAGGPGDSANRPWAGRDLGPDGETVHGFENDDGAADQAYTAALADLVAGTGSEAEVVATLAGARVFVPIVAEVAESAEGANGLAADKESDMALVTLRAPDGRTALPVFSTVGHLQNWYSGARPVAVLAPRAALSAAAEQAQLMVIDAGAPQTFVLRRPAMFALAQQKRWTPSYADPAVRAAVLSSAQRPGIQAIDIAAGSGVRSQSAQGQPVEGGGPGPELRITLHLRPGLSEYAVRALVEDLQRELTAHEVFVEQVDSLEVTLAAAAV